MSDEEKVMTLDDMIKEYIANYNADRILFKNHAEAIEKLQTKINALEGVMHQAKSRLRHHDHLLNTTFIGE